MLPFTFAGLVIASVLYSLPFMVQPLQASFEAIGRRQQEAAATLRASPLDTFFSVVLPQAKPGVISAMVMTFAHTVGEFGVILMIGGNIPGVTRVASVQIYDSLGTAHVMTITYTKTAANTWGYQITVPGAEVNPAPAGGAPAVVAAGSLTFDAQGHIATVTPTATFGTLGGIRGSRPETISATNFGSQTFIAVSFDVTGSVAPRVIANVSTGIRHRLRLNITSKYQG